MTDKPTKNIIQYLIIVIILIILFSNIIINYNSFDTYRIETIQGLKNYAYENSFNDGRVFMGFIGLIAEKININMQVLVTITAISAILILGYCVVYLKNVFLKIIEKKNIELWLLILSFLYFCNFTLIDIMQYLENIVIATSLLLYTISAKKLVLDKKWKTSLLLVILGMFFYQATICCFLQLVLLFELLFRVNPLQF